MVFSPTTKMYFTHFFALLTLVSGIMATPENIHLTKVFIIPINAVLFNWTFPADNTDMLSVTGHVFSYEPSLRNAPDLPSWMKYTYSDKHRTGYLYGVPPKRLGGVEIEIVALNHTSYETSRRVVQMNIQEKDDPAKYEVQLKIDNLNVEDMFDSRRTYRLLDVFRRKLWAESADDIYVTFLASAVQLGARLPLRPSEGEGVVMRLGSRAEFSSTLKDLQDEVKPLWKLNSCPRDFKRTTVDRLFREEGFALDWCTFKLIEDNVIPQQPSARDPPPANNVGPIVDSDLWSRPSKSQVPQRSYVSEFMLTILVPMLIMIILVLILSAILCFHHEGMVDASSEYFDSIFDIFDDYLGSKRMKDTSDIQMVQYTAVHRATHTLRSLSSQRQASLGPDSSLSRSCTTSPTSTLPRTSTPRMSVERTSIYRPNPPPYMALHRNPRADF